MPLKFFEIDISSHIYQAAEARASTEGTTLESILSEALTAYANHQETASQPAVLRTYTVKRGDSLARIAREVYGDLHQYPVIQKANNLSDPGRIWVGQVLVIPPVETEAIQEPPAPTVLNPAPAPPLEPPSVPDVPTAPPLPEAPAPGVDPCAPISGASYHRLPIVSAPTDRPAAKHGDINLALRSYNVTNSELGLIDMNGPTDGRAPQLASLFEDNRVPKIRMVYQVFNWDWAKNERGSPITDFETTLAGFEVKPGEIIRTPRSGYDIGQGHTAMVLYATPERITLKYTGEDNVIRGYTIHLEDVCVEPKLLKLYEDSNNTGRRELPVLKPEQPLGRARSTEIKVAIRDNGRFMDPRVRKDWWAGR